MITSGVDLEASPLLGGLVELGGARGRSGEVGGGRGSSRLLLGGLAKLGAPDAICRRLARVLRLEEEKV